MTGILLHWSETLKHKHALQHFVSITTVCGKQFGISLVCRHIRVVNHIEMTSQDADCEYPTIDFTQPYYYYYYYCYYFSGNPVTPCFFVVCIIFQSSIFS